MKKIKDFLQENVSFHWKDIITVLVICLLYGIISFYHLGDMDAPNTFYRAKTGETLTIEFYDTVRVEHLKYFAGEDDTQFRVYLSEDGEEYTYYRDYQPFGIFTWNDEIIKKRVKSIQIVPQTNASFGEMVFLGEDGNTIPYSSINDYLQDEPDLVPERASYMNSTIFDEVYFARSAYQYVYGMKVYEWTHPPLGKLIQAIPLAITHHLSPFNYRFMGNLAGILIVLMMYVIGGYFFKKRGYAIFSALLMAFDTFHFAHTRLGTVDSHLVLFMMISFFFMVVYFQKEKTLYLFLSGLFFGFAISVKWTGFYFGLGLAILYFLYFISHKKDLIESIVKGAIFFVVIPLFFYCSLFYLFPHNYYETTNMDMIIKEQKQMYEYHSQLDTPHFFSSKWYTWPISYRPVWYHQHTISDTQQETVSGVGNLVIWLVGILGFFYLLFRVFFRREKESVYLIIMILSLWLPYIFIGRVMFLYHYFPVLPFLFLGIVYMMKDLTEKLRFKYAIPIYLVLCLLFFILYYPIVSGIPFSTSYEKALELFDTWYF